MFQCSYTNIRQHIKLTSHFHLMLKSKISGAVPLLHCMTLWCELRELRIYLNLLLAF